MFSQVGIPHSEVPCQLQTGNLGLGTSLTVALHNLPMSADDHTFLCVQTKIFKTHPQYLFLPTAILSDLLGSTFIYVYVPKRLYFLAGRGGGIAGAGVLSHHAGSGLGSSSALDCPAIAPASQLSPYIEI